MFHFQPLDRSISTFSSSSSSLLLCWQGFEVRQRDAGSRGSYKDRWLWHVQGECVWGERCHDVLWNSGLYRSWGRTALVEVRACSQMSIWGTWLCQAKGVGVFLNSNWSLDSDPAGAEVFLLRGLVVLWSPAVWDAHWSVAVPRRRRGRAVWVYPHGHAPLSSLDQQGGQGPAGTGQDYHI